MMEGEYYKKVFQSEGTASAKRVKSEQSEAAEA